MTKLTANGIEISLIKTISPYYNLYKKSIYYRLQIYLVRTNTVSLIYERDKISSFEKASEFGEKAINVAEKKLKNDDN